MLTAELLWAFHSHTYSKIPKEYRQFLIYHLFFDKYPYSLDTSTIRYKIVPQNGIEIFETNSAMLAVYREKSFNYIVDLVAYKPYGAKQLLSWYLTEEAKFLQWAAINPANIHCIRSMQLYFRTEVVDYVSLMDYPKTDDTIQENKSNDLAGTTSVCTGTQSSEVEQPSKLEKKEN